MAVWGVPKAIAVGLGVLVELVAAEGHHLDAGWHLGAVAVGVIE